MPSVKQPCVQCKDKHLKCDEERPQCRRCKDRGLPCLRPATRSVFRHRSAANFAEPRGSRGANRGLRKNHYNELETASVSPDHHAVDLTRSTWDNEDARDSVGPAPSRPEDEDHIERRTSLRATNRADMSFTDIVLSQPIQPMPSRQETNTTSVHPHVPDPSGIQSQYLQWDRGSHGILSMNSLQSSNNQFPLKDAQEACLLRYFIDELSHWFDLCDEDRHFQLIVPRRAQEHPHLLNAIFAVAARHLSRVPQYKTLQGIKYHGRLLPHLNTHAAVEYMLKCIPALRQFHQTSDDRYRDSIIATAVILRQLEEIDDEDDDSSVEGAAHLTPSQRLNFLPIIDTVLRSPSSQSQLKHKSLMRAAYWMALRQEIYYSFTRRQPPQLILSLDLWSSASKVNKVVMHTVQVAKWRWGDGSKEEWLRLREQQELVEKDVLLELQPIYRQEADRSRGEIFPTVWYGSNIEVTSVQQAIMAKMVLIADDPFLQSQNMSRESWRKSENEVRQLILELCGIALCHPSSPPALVNAAIGVQLYGDFFTDQHERRALRGVLERYSDAHAWPVQKLLDKFAE